MSQKWNLQDIRPSGAGRERVRPTPLRRPQQDIATRPQVQTSPIITPDPDLSSIDIIDGRSMKRKRIMISVVVALLIIGAGVFMNVLLGGAEVTVYPKYKDVSVQAEFTAYKEPMVGDLSFELLTLEASGERQVSASGKQTVSERAVGNIFIYNAQTATQRLIKNTRFENPDGLVFRIKESVEVPGATKDASGNLVPGVITTEVFADGTGEQYNISPSRFTVPGLKGSDQYDKIYGESTVAFTGGFEGEKYLIDENELNTAKQALHLELRNSLLERLKAERPAGFLVYDSAVTFAFDSLPSTEYGDSLATIKERARLQVPMFKEPEFAKYLAAKTIAGYEGEDVAAAEAQSLNFSYSSGTTTTSDIANEPSLTFNLKGTTRVVWQFDENKLRTDLVGRQKTALPSVLSDEHSIERAEAVVRPFWSQSFPENSADIVIHTVVGTEKRQ